jgi:xanthine phosphoribosyltransferase
MSESKKYVISWELFDRDSRLLANMIKDSMKVKGLVGIARGGLVATAIIANTLDIRNVKTIAVASYDKDYVRSASEVLGSAEGILDGEGWVFIDDLVDSGQTAKLLRKRYPKAKIAVVYAKPDGKPHVDFFLKDMAQENWLIFPWE